MSNTYLQDLPTELLQRIIDYVDTETVLFSFQYVCQRFRIIVKTYNQHQLDFRSITKSNFTLARYLIRPENVISLILSDGYKTPGQIVLFLSLFDLSRFTRLRSITLLEVSHKNAIVYLQHIVTCPLTSLCIEYRTVSKSDDTAHVFLSENMKKLTNLRNLSLTMCPFLIQSSLKRLQLNQCIMQKSITELLLNYPQLEELSLFSVVMPSVHETSVDSMTQKSNLKSLTIESYPLCLDTIKAILSVVPSLVCLKLLAWPTLSDLSWNGCWWAEILAKYSMQLKKFEFFFERRANYATESNQIIESIINSFRGSFWLEKQWCVACNYYTMINKIELHSVPICKPFISYHGTSKTISSYNLTNVPSYSIDNVHSLNLCLIPPTAEIESNV